MKRIEDLKGNPLLLFVNPWSVRMVEERNPKLKLSEFGNMEEFRGTAQARHRENDNPKAFIITEVPS